MYYEELEKIAVSITNIANDKTKITVLSNEELYIVLIPNCFKLLINSMLLGL